MKVGRKISAVAAMGLAGCVAAASTGLAQEPYKIFLSMSYIGNDWQAEAANMVKAMAAHKSMRRQAWISRSRLPGPTHSARSSRSTAMVQQAGADAIVDLSRSRPPP